ncbi:Yip1 family protein [Bacillus bingmayongensis]|uniref:Yip1 family protein n=1 Tax=Bacillus bingmayongensis TaxID=1150157 RepID=UPI001C8D6B07|nr:Yip1 family protein [Bacillus bingmayongensis]MBY0596213.1 YIP1 family protein [Bacillus bingmayongensis]MBY0596835.1 YIP1 family protein [Bacillus bingmayongensis]MBY0596837.1 YIP1 family protein [Bacillus bingmayongensis]MBY0596838.1 YIP1 family protein [Bacillus bingmayongensis]
MEANMNTQDVGVKKPSLFGMITSPGVQFERMKTKKKVWGMFFLVALLQGLLGGLSAYVMYTSPEMVNMKKELGDLAGQSSLTSEVISGIGSSFAGAMIGTLFIAAIYKIFMMFFGNDTPYKTLLNIVVYTNIVLIIGGLINTILSLIFGSGTIQYTSLGLLFKEGTFAYGIGNTIEIFYVWNLVLIWLGLHITAGLSKVKASIPIIVLFIIKAVFLAAIMVLIAKFLPGMPM